MRRVVSPASLSGALVAAAWLTVVVTVTADVLAGSHPGHVAAVGVGAAALAVTRLVDAGRHRLLFGLLSSVVVAQPVVHAAAMLAPHDLGADDTTSASSVLLVAALIAVVGAAEGLGTAAGAGARALAAVVALLSTAIRFDTGPVVAVASPTAVGPRRRTWSRFELRRGPPPAAA